MKKHWENAYQSKAPDAVTWHQRDPGIFLKLMGHTGLPRDAAVLDVEGGASCLVDKLLDIGWTVLAISSAALALLRQAIDAGWRPLLVAC